MALGESALWMEGVVGVRGAPGVLGVSGVKGEERVGDLCGGMIILSGAFFG